jgi:hypothetical protein
MINLFVQISGWLLIGLALVHFIFPRYFNWKSELAPLTLVNRQMMEVHTFFVALTVFLMGLLAIFCSTDLIATRLGARVSLGLSIFWLARLVIQFAWYSPLLWKGKVFETSVHIGFSIFWACLSILFGWIAIQGWSIEIDQQGGFGP